jgi:hypothetical protein
LAGRFQVLRFWFRTWRSTCIPTMNITQPTVSSKSVGDGYSCRSTCLEDDRVSDSRRVEWDGHMIVLLVVFIRTITIVLICRLRPLDFRQMPGLAFIGLPGGCLKQARAAPNQINAELDPDLDPWRGRTLLQNCRLNTGSIGGPNFKLRSAQIHLGQSLDRTLR